MLLYYYYFCRRTWISRTKQNFVFYLRLKRRLKISEMRNRIQFTQYILRARFFFWEWYVIVAFHPLGMKKRCKPLTDDLLGVLFFYFRRFRVFTLLASVCMCQLLFKQFIDILQSPSNHRELLQFYLALCMSLCLFNRLVHRSHTKVWRRKKQPAMRSDWYMSFKNESRLYTSATARWESLIAKWKGIFSTEIFSSIFIVVGAPHSSKN